ncbi:DUF3889 domain-containing protein [Virgibacillus byunsanensis]|uniref:DUF3889 domain-containing protein n=1 Tax=Virgibacillus byunsanensis TaxID=570945 RepID=A0ABW3LS75_9BACI
MQYMNWYVNSPYHVNPYYGYYGRYSPNPYYINNRQQPTRGQATWTEGGQVTQCGIPWSTNRYMTAAVGEDSPYQCGDILKIRNQSIPGREVIVTVVDQVSGYPANKINLHRRAFEALGANLSQGVINIDIIPSPELEEQKWGKYLLEVVQIAYPGYSVTDYNKTGETQMNAAQKRETYEYMLQSPAENIKVQGSVIYNTDTDRIVSFDIQEVNG